MSSRMRRERSGRASVMKTWPREPLSMSSMSLRMRLSSSLSKMSSSREEGLGFFLGGEEFVLCQFEGDDERFLLALRAEFLQNHPVDFKNVIVLVNAPDGALRVQVAGAVLAEFSGEVVGGHLALVNHRHAFFLITQKSVVFFEQRQKLLHERPPLRVKAEVEGDERVVVGFQQIHVEVVALGEELQKAVALVEHLVVLQEIFEIVRVELREYPVEKTAAAVRCPRGRDRCRPAR